MKSIMILIATALIMSSNIYASNYKNIVKSSAFELESGRFIYNELHVEEYIKKNIYRSITEYVDPNGKIISKRIMNFDKDSTKPSFTLEDFQTGYLEGAEVIETGKVKVVFREDKSEKIETKILSIDEPFVIDGGLTYFFRKHWSSLSENKTIEFNFVVPSKLDYFKFRVSNNGIKNISGFTGMELKLEPASFILRQFVDPILITYDLQTKKILLYKGISNVNNDNGKSYSVLIDYTKQGLE